MQSYLRPGFGTGLIPRQALGSAHGADTRAQKIFQKYILKIFFKEKYFMEINISKVKSVLQVESQHPAYVYKSVTITCKYDYYCMRLC